MSLHPNLRNKFLKVCARMDSANDWERAAAALLATRMLAGVGLTWRDLLNAAPSAGSASARRHRSRLNRGKDQRKKAAEPRRSYAPANPALEAGA